jgi:broad specificity phosphatase PhoE
MPLIHLVRHAEPAALWGAHPDPGLSPLGHAQAVQVAQKLQHLKTVSIVSSPLARCQQTCAPFADLMGLVPRIEPAVAEIPLPDSAKTDPRAWLQTAMAARWREPALGPDLARWRDGVAVALLSMVQETVVFTHFVAINAAVGVAQFDDHVTVFKPGHASITTLRAENGRLSVVSLGSETPVELA